MSMVRLLFCASVLAAAPLHAEAQARYAAQLSAERCASCHEAGAGGAARIPSVSQLKGMTPTAILKALDTGVMRAQTAPLSANDRQAIANGLKGHGGALDVGGPVIAGGMVFATSGSAQRNGLPGNVLLGCAVDR